MLFVLLVSNRYGIACVAASKMLGFFPRVSVPSGGYAVDQKGQPLAARLESCSLGVHFVHMGDFVVGASLHTFTIVKQTLKQANGHAPRHEVLKNDEKLRKGKKRPGKGETMSHVFIHLRWKAMAPSIYIQCEVRRCVI